MMIPVTVGYDLESVTSLQSLPESPCVNLKQAEFYTQKNVTGTI